MPAKNTALTLTYTAWDTINSIGKTGDAANHTLKVVVDGTEGAVTGSITEVDSTNLKGEYKVTLTTANMNGNMIKFGGVSSASGIVIIPIAIFTDGGVLPVGVAAGALGGLITSGTGTYQINTVALATNLLPITFIGTLAAATATTATIPNTDTAYTSTAMVGWRITSLGGVTNTAGSFATITGSPGSAPLVMSGGWSGGIPTTGDGYEIVFPASGSGGGGGGGGGGGTTMISWGSFAADSVFAGLATPGLVPPGGKQNGQLISNAGVSFTKVTYNVTGQGGVPFPPGQVFVAILEDIDGTNTQSALLPNEAGQGVLLQALEPISQNATKTAFNGTILVPSTQIAGFRFHIHNFSPVGVIVAVNFKQG